MIIKFVMKFLPTCLPSGLTVAAPDAFGRIPGVFYFPMTTLPSLANTTSTSIRFILALYSPLEHGTQQGYLNSMTGSGQTSDIFLSLHYKLVMYRWLDKLVGWLF